MQKSRDALATHQSLSKKISVARAAHGGAVDRTPQRGGAGNGKRKADGRDHANIKRKKQIPVEEPEEVEEIDVEEAADVSDEHPSDDDVEADDGEDQGLPA